MDVSEKIRIHWLHIMTSIKNLELFGIRIDKPSIQVIIYELKL